MVRRNRKPGSARLGTALSRPFPADFPRFTIRRFRSRTFPAFVTPDRLRRIAHRLMQHPTAPFHEHAVRDEVERICAENRLEARSDSFGNLLIHAKRGRAGRPLVLAAHLDHPGFEILSRLSSTHWKAKFCGGVPDRYFR